MSTDTLTATAEPATSQKAKTHGVGSFLLQFSVVSTLLVFTVAMMILSVASRDVVTVADVNPNTLPSMLALTAVFAGMAGLGAVLRGKN